MEATELFDIYKHEDDSVQKKLSKKAIKLQKKYYKRRKINEKFLKKKSPLKKAFSIVFDVVCVFVALVCGVACFCNISSRFQNLPPSIGGYMAMQIASPSMVASGFDVGENVMVQAVDTDTLKVGDIIAFYNYEPGYAHFNAHKAKKIDSSTIGDLKYEVSIPLFFGFRNDEINTAAKDNAKRVIHQIVTIYEDADGVRYFETKGTSNNSKDRWFVKETLIIGAYTNSAIAKVMSHVMNAMTSSVGTIIILMIPLVIIAIFIVGLCLKDVQIAMLENEVVEEKIKLTDDICVRNNIGYQMSNKVKYKVLATAPPEDKLKYIGLLWKDGKTPNAMKKYYLRKRVLIKTLEAKNELNRECERLFEAGENPKNIAQYYETEKAKIEKKYENYKKKMGKIKQNNDTRLAKEKEDEKLKSKRSSKQTKETGVDKKSKKPTVNKQKTEKDSSSIG